MGPTNISRGTDHLRGLITDSFRVVILGTYDGAFSELSGMLRCTLASGSVTVGTAMGMRGKIRVGKRRCVRE